MSEEVDRETQDQLIADAIRNRLDTYYFQYAPHMVLNWVVVALAIEKDGEKVIYQTFPEDSRRWERLGMLEHIVCEEKNSMLLLNLRNMLEE